MEQLYREKFPDALKMKAQNEVRNQALDPSCSNSSGPKLCVQVKSSKSQVDVTVIRELQGVMQNFGAEQGLLVSWGGFNTKALQESRKQFFSNRLLDQDELLDEIMKYYDKFDDELKAELPLKRIWALVKEE